MSTALNHDIIDRDAIVDRYVRGDLDEHELLRFEEHFSTCAQCMNQIELAEAFMRDYRMAFKAGWIEPTAPAAKRKGYAPWIGLAIAAALLLVLSPRFFQAGPTVAWQLEADVTRSSDIRSFDLPQSGERVVLRLQVSAPFYRATLIDAHGERLAASEGQGQQVVELPPTKLKAGRYQVDLEISQDGVTWSYEGEYPFMVESPE
jgi:anti-sigma factor RsiW